MRSPFLPDAPWQLSPIPDSRAIVTPDGYFLLDLEGLDTDNPDALRRAVAALPDLLDALKLLLYGAEQAQRNGLNQPQINGGVTLARAALTKAGFTLNQ